MVGKGYGPHQHINERVDEEETKLALNGCVTVHKGRAFKNGVGGAVNSGLECTASCAPRGVCPIKCFVTDSVGGLEHGGGG